MNRIHRLFCRSGFWKKQLEESLLPWVLRDTELGNDVLEVGPGPGLATDLLRPRVEALTSIEIDTRLASSLEARMSGTNVEVVHGDATDMPFEPKRFSATLCFTMLHHVPSSELQDRLLREVHRVLRPGGVFLGSDSRTSLGFELIHLFDTLVPVDPQSFGSRLEAAGFRDIEVATAKRSFRFSARRVT